MKKLLFAFTIIFSIYSASIAQTIITDSIYTGGVYRSYRIYIPAIYTASSQVPLVFNFHGLNTMNFEQEVYGDFRPIADTANFIIVHPQGIESDGYIGWNNFGSIALASDDINFISNLIDTLSTQYAVNPNKIYSTGFSNGGFMSYDLACLLNTRFAAIASVSGSMVLAHKNACNPQHPTPVMQIHGTSDYVVSYSGSGGIVSSVNIDSLVKYWVNYNNCNAVPVITNLPDVDASDLSTVIHKVYNGGTLGSTVEFYKITGGDHSWPGTLDPGGWSNVNMDFNASKEIWRFFSRYSLNSLSTKVNQAMKEDEFLIYPNPSNGTFTLKALAEENCFVEITNTLGEKVFESEVKSANTAIDLSNQTAGMYWCKLRSSAQTKIIKVIVR